MLIGWTLICYHIYLDTIYSNFACLVNLVITCILDNERILRYATLQYIYIYMNT